ncbi:MAG: phage/plasmid primase, P4 family [Methanospirillum sp.]
MNARALPLLYADPAPGEIAVDSAGTRAAVEAAVTRECRRFNSTDTGNGKRFALRHAGSARYCVGRDLWYLFDGTRWTADPGRTVRELAKATAVAINAEAADEPDDRRRRELQRWAKESESSARIRAMLEMASTDPAVRIAPDDLDADPDLVTLRNGTLDLRTLALRPHRPGDLITRLANVDYDPDAACPIWEAHLRRIFAGDDGYIRSLQELLGYALLAGNPLQIFPIWWGSGANGKSVTIAAVRSILGDYAVSAAAETFMAKATDGGPRPDVLALRGARLVVAVESERGHRLNEAFVKQMTGGDPWSGRNLYSPVMETFLPSHLAILVTNPLPAVRGIEDAIWRRLQFWPFGVTIPAGERVPEYDRVLLEEAPGILSWMLDGLRRYCARGRTIAVPPPVEAATARHRFEMDALAPFLRDECVRDSEGVADRADLYDRYEVYCTETGDEPLSKRAFANALKERGVADGPSVRGRRTWRGLRVRTAAERSEAEATGSLQENL